MKMGQQNYFVLTLLINLIVIVGFNCHFVNSSDPVRDEQPESLENEVTVEVDDSDPDVRIDNILRNKPPVEESTPYYSFNFAEHLKKYNVDTSKLDDKEVTALAQRFEYPVENYLHRDNNSTNDTASQQPPPKLFKVNCLTSYLPSIEELQRAEAEILAYLKNKSKVEETPLNETVGGKISDDAAKNGEEIVEKSNSTEDESEMSNGDGLDTDGLNSTLNAVPRVNRVELVNTSTLLNTVLYINPAVKNRSTASNCTLVFFYTDWCPFSANAAPHFNALPRAFPSIRMVGLNLNQGGYSQNYFGVLSIPTIVLFHNGKMISKFNDSSFTIHKFIRFVYRYTDLVVSELRINVTSEDFKGPISSIPTKLTDYNLIIAWIFLIFCFIHFISKSTYWISFIELVKSIWRDAEEHEHLE